MSSRWVFVLGCACGVWWELVIRGLAFIVRALGAFQ